MRVLHLITSMEPGGIELWLMKMLEAVPGDRCAMDVCCKGRRRGRLAPAAEALGARVHHIRLTPTHWRYVAGVSSVLRRGRYDIAHVHLGAYSGLGVWIGKRAGVATVTTFHSTAFAPQTWTRYPGLRQLRAAYARVSVDFALKRSDVVTASSQAILAALAQRHRWLSGGRVLPLAVDPAPAADEAGRGRLRVALGWSPEVPLVIHVGSFRREKNHLGLLEIFRRIVAGRPEARLLLVGDGVLREAVEARIVSLGLSEKVRCLGVRSDVPALLASSDLLLMPSRSEGFGLAAIEAGAAGIPVVASAVGGLEEAVVHDQTGLLFPLDEPGAMADAVVGLLNDPGRARRMGEAGRERAVTQFSAAASARQLLDAYDESIRRHNSFRRHA